MEERSDDPRRELRRVTTTGLRNGSLLVVSLAMVTLEELLRSIDDLSESPPAYELIRRLPKDRAMVPELVAALQKYVDEENFYGRDVIAQALAELEGVEALAVLLRASAVDLGDDQDTLAATLTDLLWMDPQRAGEILDGLDDDADPRVRDVSVWARTFVEGYLRRKG